MISNYVVVTYCKVLSQNLLNEIERNSERLEYNWPLLWESKSNLPNMKHEIRSPSLEFCHFHVRYKRIIYLNNRIISHIWSSEPCHFSAILDNELQINKCQCTRCLPSVKFVNCGPIAPQLSHSIKSYKSKHYYF